MSASKLKSKLLRNLGANAYGQLITVAIQLVSVPFFLHYWGVELYGEWLILSAIPVYLNLSDIGFASVAANDMTMRVAKGDQLGALEVYQSIWCLICTISVLIGCIVSYLIFHFPINEFLSLSIITPEQTSETLFILMLYVLLGLQGGVFNAGFRASGHYAYGTTLNNTIRLAEWLVSMVILAWGGEVYMVALATLITRLLGTIVLWMILHVQTSWLSLGLGSATLKVVLSLFKPAIAFMAFPLGLSFSLQGMVLIIGIFLGSTAVTIFSTYRTLTRVLVQVVAISNRAIWPEVSSAYGAGKMHVVNTLHQKGSSAAFWIAFAGIITLSLFGEFIIGLWTHHSFQPNHSLLYLLLVTGFLHVLWQTSWVVLMGINLHQKISVAFIMAASTGLAISVFLLPRMGISGVGIALIIAELPMLFIAVNSCLVLLNDNWGDYSRSVIFPFFKKRQVHQ